MSKRVAIGIDLGTSYSCVGVYREGKVDIIENNVGRRITPSWVAFDDDGILIGEAAKLQASVNPKNTVFETKRLIGRKFDYPEVRNDVKQWPFDVLNDDNAPKIRINYRNEELLLTPEEISAKILIEMRNLAEKRIGHDVHDAVVTVPAYFNDSQRQATIDAGRIAGLNVLSIINEPTAAAIAYGVDKESSLNQNILVFDFGGGTFDVAVLSIVDKNIRVKAVGGDTHLGGGDIDSRLVDHFLKLIVRKYKKVIDGNCRALGRLRGSCETAKIALSSVVKTKVTIDCLFDGEDLKEFLTRAKLEELCDDLFTRTIEHVRKVLSDANLSKSDIDEVVLVGGSSRIPKVRELLQGFFGINKLNETINPDEAVAYGATVRAHQMLSVDDTAQKITLHDIIPFSLGMEGAGDDMRIFIPRNSPIPTTVTQHNWSTGEDYQDTVIVSVYEGESLQASENNLLGRFELHHGEQEKKGVPQLAFTFTVDANGILHVSGENSRTNRKDGIIITTKKGRLSEVDIQMMKETARRSKNKGRKQVATSSDGLPTQDPTLVKTKTGRPARGDGSEEVATSSDGLPTQDPTLVKTKTGTAARGEGCPPLHSKGKHAGEVNSVGKQKVWSYCCKQRELLLAAGQDSLLGQDERDTVLRACEEALQWLELGGYKEEEYGSKLLETELKCTLIMGKLRRKGNRKFF